MKKLATGLVLAGLATVGCEVDVHEAASTPENQPGVNVDVGTSAENRTERREERREAIRDAIDGVNVEVGDGAVKVDVEER